MSFRFACFISYRHAQGELSKSFVNELKNTLQECIEPYLNEDVYIDVERLQGGDFFNPELADALCHSVCMIPVLTPKYFDCSHTYCAREFAAMKRLETQRLQLMQERGMELHRNRGLIIPVVFRGAKYLPSEICQDRQYYDFSSYSTATPRISTSEKYVADIEKIAEYIFETYQTFRALEIDPSEQCIDFSLPNDDEIQAWLSEITSPKIPLPWR